MPFNKESKSLSITRTGRWRQLNEELVYTCPDDKEIYAVPIGFTTDFASIPKLGRFFTSNEDYRIVLPAVVHDYLYSNKPVCRKRADEIFYIALREQGVGIIKSRIMWMSVRVGGGSHY